MVTAMRWRRARLWTRWALRDARRHRVQMLSIAVLLALGVGMYAAMSSMSVWRVDSADSSFAALRMHDLRVTLAEGSTAPEGALRRAVASLSAPYRLRFARHTHRATLAIRASSHAAWETGAARWA